MASINVKVTQLVKRLQEKVRKKGLWENFGQDELRKLKDEFYKTYRLSVVNSNVKYFEGRKQKQFERDYKALQNFSEWIMNYNGR